MDADWEALQGRNPRFPTAAAGPRSGEPWMANGGRSRDGT